MLTWLEASRLWAARLQRTALRPGVHSSPGVAQLEGRLGSLASAKPNPAERRAPVSEAVWCSGKGAHRL